MGSGGTKIHETFTVTPGQGVIDTDTAAGTTSSTGTPWITDPATNESPSEAEPVSAASAQVEHKVAQLLDQLHTENLAAGTATVPDSNQPPVGAVLVSPADVIEAQTAFTEALHTINQTPAADLTGSHLSALIAAEDKLATIWCPEVAQQHAQAAAQARLAVDEIVGSNPALATDWLADRDSGFGPESIAAVLSVSEGVRLLRKSTPAGEAQHLDDLCQNRSTELSDYKDCEEALAELNDGSVAGPIASMDTANEVTDWLHASRSFLDSQDKVNEWNHEPTVASAETIATTGPATLSAQFRKKAKTVPLSTLKNAAVENGMDPDAATAASRAQTQSWLLAGLTPSSATETKAAILAKLPSQPTPIPTPTGALPPAQPTTTPQTSHPSGSITDGVVHGLAGKGRWAAGHKNLIAALKHQTSSLQDVPGRPDASQVQQWHFNPGPDMALGGAHTKAVLTAPDGSHWLFKPDRHGGARAVAEATASTILHRVGIPTPPVYSRTVQGKHGAIQPLMKGASQLPAVPKQWSQADVDAIVRFHAAAWLIGNHDAKHDNMLRTASGGLVPIDHGQAFKYFGEDQLSSTYHPNGSFGAREPVWNSLYTAAKTGGLAPGVRIRASAATPIIQTIESMPDDEYRAMIHPVAKAGATKDQIHWSATMRQRAAKAAGSASPTAAQIADEFVKHAVERKRTIRKTFLDFFATEGLADSDLLNKVA